MENWEFIVAEAYKDQRLDILLAQSLEGTSRTQAQRLIEDEAVLVNGYSTKANYKVKTGDRITCRLAIPQPLETPAENIPLDIVYEDENLLVVNKPKGMVVHPASGVNRGTMVNALLYHCRDLSGINGVLRPGIVHRIDKDTSGLLLVAKNDLAHQDLALQLKNHTVKREYLALVQGVMMEPGGLIEAPIGRDVKDRQKMAVVLKNSKKAVTRYTVLERLPGYTLIECRLETGRTHQIRVHMDYIGHPVVGDPKYGSKKNNLGIEGQALHARTIGFVNPGTGEWQEFSIDPPQDFMEALGRVGSKYFFV